jgi:hypothetical protein
MGIENYITSCSRRGEPLEAAAPSLISFLSQPEYTPDRLAQKETSAAAGRHFYVAVIETEVTTGTYTDPRILALVCHEGLLSYRSRLQIATYMRRASSFRMCSNTSICHNKVFATATRVNKQLTRIRAS